MVPTIPFWYDIPANIILILATAIYLFFYIFSISLQFLILKIQRERFKILCIVISCILGVAASILSFIAINYYIVTKTNIISKFDIHPATYPGLYLLIFSYGFIFYLLVPLIVLLILTLIFFTMSKERLRNPIIRALFYIQAFIWVGLIGIILNHQILVYIGKCYFTSIFV